MVETNTYIKNKLTPQDSSAVDRSAMEWSSAAKIYSTMLRRFSSKFRVDWLVYQWNGSINHLPLDAESAPGTWVPASEDSINLLFASDGSRRRKFLSFLKSDCIGLFLARDGQWIAYCWSAQPGHKGRPPHLPRRISSAGAYWIFYCHTRSTFRGQGIFKRMLAEFISLIHSRSPDAQIYLDSLPDNVPSNRAVVRSGFAPSGVIVTYNLRIPSIGNLVLGGRWLPNQQHTPLYVPSEPPVGGLSKP
jgi:RimJ/RimL family protein N-acetyltransferase